MYPLFYSFKAIKYTIGLRLSDEHERLGADYVEHGIGTSSMDLHRTLSSRDVHSPLPLQAGRSSDVISRTSTCDEADNVNLVKRRKSKSKIRSDKVVPINIINGQVRQSNLSII